MKQLFYSRKRLKINTEINEEGSADPNCGHSLLSDLTSQDFYNKSMSIAVVAWGIKHQMCQESNDLYSHSCAAYPQCVQSVLSPCA